MINRIIDFFGAAQVSGKPLRGPGLPWRMMIHAGVGVDGKLSMIRSDAKSPVTLVTSGFPNFLDQVRASEHYAINVVQPNPGF